MKRTISILLGVCALLVGALTVPALATGGHHTPPTCEDKTITVLDYTIPAVPEVWANFQPTDVHAPFVGPPSYPSDERGGWITHNQIPGGHEGPDGVYYKGNPDKGGNWFYRQAGMPEQDVYKQVPNPDYPCDEPCPQPKVAAGATPPPCHPTEEPTPTEPPTTEPPMTETPTPTPPVTETPTIPPITETPTPAPPTTEPPTEEPPTWEAEPPTREVRCVGDALDVTITDAMGNVEHRSIQGAKRCERDEGEPPVIEEGM